VERLPVLPVDAPRTAFAPIPAAQAEGENPADQPGPEASPYSPLKSLPPDFFSPDLYLGPSDVQAGLITWGTDVSRDYSVGAGARYSFNLEYVCLQGNAQIRGLGLSYARYPLSYDPKNQPATEESRSEASLSFRHPDAPWATLSLTRQHYEPLEPSGHGSDP
jgi:hypothetical protein